MGVISAVTAATAMAGSLKDIPFKTMDGKDTSLNDYKGKVVMLVNVASKCGNTPQYAGLEKLYKEYADKNFVILGFPCNDFGAQEPGSNAEIRQFCSATYQVTFPLMDKVHVKGAEQSPLYNALTGATAKFPGDVKWNFGKFLVDKNGEVVARFEPDVQPNDPQLVSAVNAALK